MIPGTWQPATDRFVRRVGRPRKEWVPAVLGEARARIGNDACLVTALQSKPFWKQAIRNEIATEADILVKPYVGTLACVNLHIVL